MLAVVGFVVLALLPFEIVAMMHLGARAGVPAAVLVPALLIAVTTLEVVETRSERRRQRERVQTWSVQNGWRYQETDRVLTRTWAGEPFGAGRWRSAVGVLRGVHRGREVVSFTYRWTTGFARSRTTHTRDVVVLDLPASLPSLQIAPEDEGSLLFRGQDLRVELEQFNARWHVESADPRFAHGVLHPLLIEVLMKQAERGLGMRIDGSSILAWAIGPSGPYGTMRLADLLCTVVESIPLHVWQDFGREPRVPVAR